MNKKNFPCAIIPRKRHNDATIKVLLKIKERVNFFKKWI